MWLHPIPPSFPEQSPYAEHWGDPEMLATPAPEVHKNDHNDTCATISAEFYGTRKCLYIVHSPFPSNVCWSQYVESSRWIWRTKSRNSKNSRQLPCQSPGRKDMTYSNWMVLGELSNRPICKKVGRASQVAQ